jgi:hypothetical protein
LALLGAPKAQGLVQNRGSPAKSCRLADSRSHFLPRIRKLFVGSKGRIIPTHPHEYLISVAVSFFSSPLLSFGHISGAED